MYKVINCTAFTKKIFWRATSRDVVHYFKNLNLKNFPVFLFYHACPGVKSKFRANVFTHTQFHLVKESFAGRCSVLLPVPIIFFWTDVNNYGSVIIWPDSVCVWQGRDEQREDEKWNDGQRSLPCLQSTCRKNQPQLQCSGPAHSDPLGHSTPIKVKEKEYCHCHQKSGIWEALRVL